MTYRLLDLFCCEGGAARGYHSAGFEVVGVDIAAQPRYPYEFHQGDALEYLREYGREFDAIHASPPCQRYSAGTKGLTEEQRAKHPDLVGPTRDALMAWGGGWVMENVEGSPLENPLTLCGTMFGLGASDFDGAPLQLRRHRLFESSVFLYPPAECRHDGISAGVYGHGGQHVHSRPLIAGVYDGARRTRDGARERRGGYVPADKAVRASLLGLDPGEHTNHGLAQAIPPAYTEWIGIQLIDYLEAAAA